MDQDEAEERGWQFGEYHLLPRRRVLLHQGSPVPLGSRALGILIFLVERYGRLVTKDEIMTAVWPGTVVEQHNIVEQVKNLRKALAPGAITTIPGRGYQFTAELTLPARPKPEPAAPAPEPVSAGPESNLPQRLSDLIGRAAELAALRDSIAAHRLVTLAGPGGIGKTRLALEVGRQATPLFADGVWLVDLAPLNDPAVLAGATATALGVALRDAAAPVDAIAAAIAKRHLLLIFDNCEYLAEAAAALISALLARVPGLTVLATSQEVLGLPAEQIHRLEPLALPPADAVAIKGFGAIDLFVERAEAADRRFRLDPKNAASVAEICRGLDGLPLALEVAACRLPLFGIEGLRARLGERLLVFGPRPRTSETRHRTLAAMVAWSHGLLDAGDQVVFRRLAVFRGSFSLDAVVAVAGEAGSDAWPTVDALGRLMDKSLVTAEGGDEPRYRLLETLRLYAAAKLAASGESEAIGERHARYLVALFDEADKVWETTPQAEWVGKFRVEIDNVRVGLDWALRDRGSAQIGVALAGATGRLWYGLALVAEGRGYLDQARTLIDDDTPHHVTARLLRSAAILWYSSDRPCALALLEQSAALYRKIDDRTNLATTLSWIGTLYGFFGRNAEAKAVLCEAQEILSESDHYAALYSLEKHLGILSWSMNETMEARHYYARALELARILKDVLREMTVIGNLAELEFSVGAFDRALELAREAVDGIRSAGRLSTLGWALSNLASYLTLQNSLPEARAAAEEAFSLLRVEGGHFLRLCLEQWALLGALEGRPGEAARLIGFVDVAYSSACEIRETTEREIYGRLMTLLQSTLPSADIGARVAEGARWSEEQAAVFAFDHLISPVRRGTI